MSFILLETIPLSLAPSNTPSRKNKNTHTHIYIPNYKNTTKWVHLQNSFIISAILTVTDFLYINLAFIF
jgi:hypothetical protein